MKSIQEIIKEGTSDIKLWDALDKLKEALGAEKLIDELCKAMSDDDLKQCLKFIAKNNEINIKL